MKTFLLTALLPLSCCLVSGVNAASEDALKIRAELTLGERSKDSSSQTTVITVDDDTMVWEQTESGARGAKGEKSPRRKVFTLSAAQKGNVVDTIAASELLITDSLKVPHQPPVFYFALRMKLAVGTTEGAIEIAGPRSAGEIRASRLYGRSINVMKALYAIIHAQDKSIIFEEPLRARR